MKQERIDPGWVWAQKLNISAGVKIGDTIYLSGTVAFDSDGNVSAMYTRKQSKSLRTSKTHSRLPVPRWQMWSR